MNRAKKKNLKFKQGKKKKYPSKKLKKVEHNIWIDQTTKKYYIDFCFRYKRYRLLAGYSLTKARVFLARAMTAAREGRLNEFLGRSPSKNIAFAEYGRQLLDSAEWKQKRSARRNEISFSHLKKYFGEFKLNEINPAHVRKYMSDRLDKGFKPATINREITLLKSILYQAEYDGLIQSNPIRGRRLKKLEENNSREKVIAEMNITESDLRRLIDSCPDRIRPIVIIAITTGMRLNEILKMRWSDFNLNLRTIKISVENSKTKEERIIPVSAELAALIDSMPRTGEKIFEGIKDIRKSWSLALKQAEFPDNLRFHDLRHIAAYRLVKITDVMTAARILGHKDIKTTMRYLFTTEKDKREAMEKSWERLFSFVDQSSTKKLEEEIKKKGQITQVFDYQ